MKVTIGIIDTYLVLMLSIIYIYYCWVNPLTDPANLVNPWYITILIAHLSIYLTLSIATLLSIVFAVLIKLILK